MAKQAIEGTRGTHFMRDPNSVLIIGLDTEDGPEHPYWDERIDIHPKKRESLVLSMMLHGFDGVIIVANDGDDVFAVDGRQRLLAMREANSRLKKAGKPTMKIACKRRKGSELGNVGLSIALNNCRVDSDPMMNVRALERYINLGGTEEAAAIEFNVSGATISNWMKIACASKEEQEAFSSRAMNMQEVVAQSGKPRKERVETAKAAKAAVEAGAPPKKRGRPKGGGPPSRKVECNRVIKALEEAPKDMLVHPEFERGMRFAMGLLDAKRAGVAKILKAATPKASK